MLTNHEPSFLPASDYRTGDRVQLHPATDAWMQGDRYGTVFRIGRLYLYVRMDRSERSLKVHPRNVAHA